MKAGNRPFRGPSKNEAVDLLEQFISLFESKGWLNHTLRIKHHDRRYRICCRESEFFAYRINDHMGVSPGFPGWPVCLVTSDQLIEDSDMSALESSEPTAQEWLNCIAEGDFDFLEEGHE